MRQNDGERDRPYQIEGSLLESCSCWAPCPCWLGADPDGGSCQGFNAYHVEAGTIDGVEISGCDFVRVFDIDGNVQTPGSWRQVFVIDADASAEQVDAILDAYTGAFGGPLADLALLVRQTLGVERAQILYEAHEGSGRVRAGKIVSVSLIPFRGAGGKVTTLVDSLMASVPRAPAHVAKAAHHTVSLQAYGLDWAFEGRSAIQSRYRVCHGSP
jgi:hypothetical protein